MKQNILILVMSLFAVNAMAEIVGFDQDQIGAPPAGWICGVTGRGSPKWTIEADSTAPSKPNVLKQSGSGTFPWCAKKGVAISDGFVEVKFKPMQGSEDRAGGAMWRWKDGDNYYVARANALENNVSLYHTTRGGRQTIKYVDAPVQVDQWHTLHVEFTGKRIKVSLDGKQYIDIEDAHIVGAGSVGVWTKADSITAFDDFSWGGN